MRVTRQHLTLIALGGLLAWVFIVVSGVVDGVRGKAGDFQCFHEAAVAALAGQDIYEAGTRGYIYPPALAWLIQPLGFLPQHIAAAAWAVVMGAAIPLVVILAVRESIRRFSLMGVEPIQVAAAASIAVLVVGDKLLRELKEGNCNVVLIAATVVGLWSLGRRPLLCGVALGLAIHIKYLAVVFIPYLVVRGRWKELGATLAGVALFSILPMLTFGPSRTLDYLQRATTGVERMAGPQAQAEGAANIKPITWDASVSIPSALARWEERTGRPGLMIVGVALAALTALAIGAFIYRRARIPLMLGRWGVREDRDPRRLAMTAVEWFGLAAAALVFSPQAAARHFNMALPIVAVAATLVVAGRTPHRRLVAGALAVFVAAMLLPPGSWREMLQAWRDVAGMSLSLLVLLFITTYAASDEARCRHAITA